MGIIGEPRRPDLSDDVASGPVDVRPGRFVLALGRLGCYGTRPRGHSPLLSVESTVRQLKEPKISHFDQLACKRIGKKTARNSSAVK